MSSTEILSPSEIGTYSKEMSSTSYLPSGITELYLLSNAEIASSKSDGDESRAVDLYEYVLINAVTGKEILKDVGTI